MKKTNQFYLFIVFLALQGISVSYGQEKSETYRYLQTTDHGSLLKVIRTQGHPILDEDKNQIIYKDELEIDGQKISLAKGENYESSSGEIILTSQLKSQTNKIPQKIINSYTLSNKTLQKKGSLAVDDINSYQVVKDTKNILMSDEYEGVGYEINLYTNTLNKIAVYKPFGDIGFRQSLLQYGHSTAVFVFFPIDKKTKAKLVQINTLTGSIDFEVDLNSEMYKITKLIIAGDYIFLKQHRSPAQQELLCFNNRGQMLWKKLEYVYALKGFKDNNEWKVFAMDTENYWFINIENGIETEKKSIKAIAGEKNIDSDVWIDLSTNSKESEIFILASQKDSESDFIHEVFSIKDSKEIPKKIHKIESSDRVLSFIRLSSKLLLTNSKNQILKEYEN